MVFVKVVLWVYYYSFCLVIYTYNEYASTTTSEEMEGRLFDGCIINGDWHNLRNDNNRKKKKQQYGNREEKIGKNGTKQLEDDKSGQCHGPTLPKDANQNAHLQGNK